MKGFSAATVLITGLVLIMIALGVVYLFPILSPAHPSPSPAANAGLPEMKVNDMAPGMPLNKKTAVVIMHSDSSYEKVLLPSSTVEEYIKSLPKGDKIISQTSPVQ